METILLETISFPLQLNDSGIAVANLHQAILGLAEKVGSGSFREFFDNKILQEAFTSEIRDRQFGPATEAIVSSFQKSYMMQDASGIVDEPTADAINLLLRQTGMVTVAQQAPVKYRVHGTVRDQWQQPLRKNLVAAFDKDIRSEQTLGEIFTDDNGYYEIDYNLQKFAETDKLAADVFLRLYDSAKKLLKQTDIVYNAPSDLTLDVTLSTQPFRGISEFEEMLAAITPYTGKLPLTTLTENADTQDITFLTNKTRLQQEKVRFFAMAYNFEAQTKVSAIVFYGLLREGVPADRMQNLLQNISAPTYQQLAAQKLDGIMHEKIDTLMQALQHAINDNIVPFSLTATLERIREELLSAIKDYSANHPGTGDHSSIFQTVQIAGLTEEQTKQAIGLLTQHKGDIDSFFTSLGSIDEFKGTTEKLGVAFQLNSVNGDHLALTDVLVNKAGINTDDALKSLAGKTAADWEKILTAEKLDVPAGTMGKTPQDKLKTYAATLEDRFTKKFPTAAFAARLQSDSGSKIPGSQELGNFLAAHPEFDLIKYRVGTFMTDQAKGISEKSKSTLTGQFRRVQRVFKLAPDYNATHAIMSKGIHSAQQIYAMGPDRFAEEFSPVLGDKAAKQIFAKAANTHASALAVAGNIHSLATASKINMMPDYEKAMGMTSAAKEIPNLDALFEHADFCECDECSSVYGAASYLTDGLHFLSQRMGDTTGTVRDKLLARRPDIGDIDLNCDNTNTELPYIDIVNEILEETIAPTVFSIPITFTANLPVFAALTPTEPLPDRQYAIQPPLLAQLITHTADLPQIDILLTANAQVSDGFQATGSTSTQWIIRDKNLVLKLTENAGDISVQLLHQTLLSTDELSANPEYTNVNVYDNFLKTAKLPFGLPFDLFSTEGNIYLTKLGISKNDLIRIFAKEHLPAATPPTAELDEAYAFLGASFEERDLIFKPDPANQVNYWGTLAGSPKVEVDLFLQYTGLQYADLQALLTLQFINPAGDSKIDHDDLSCDLNKQHITNVTSQKFDHLHRFIRLWKKTTLTMEELDACIQCPALHTDGINPPVIEIDPLFAWQFHHFLELTDWTIFPLLAFYEDIQTTGDDSLYNSLFQNKQITNPVNTDFALANVNLGKPLTDIHKAVIESAIMIMPTDLNTLLSDNAITTLSLSNLSFIYKINLLMQAESLSADDFRIARQVIPVDPFKSPVTTTDFLSKLNELNQSGLSVWDVNYILRQQNDLNQTLVPADATVIANLGALQDTLLQIQAATTVQPDPHGDLLSKWITDPLLRWDPVVSARLISILRTANDDDYTNTIIPSAYTFLKNLRVVYDQASQSTTLSALNPIDNLSQLSTHISYNAGTKMLSFTGAMTTNEQAALLGAFADADYQAAVNQLYQASQGNPNSSTALDALPLLTSYVPCSGQLTYNGDTKMLRFAGYLDATTRDALKNFYINPNIVRDALDAIFAAQQTDNSPANIFFATNLDVDTNLKSLDYAHIAERFDFFLQKISPKYRTMQQQAAIQNRISTWFTVDKTISAQLLLSVPAIYTDWTNAGFIGKINVLNKVNYPAQYNQYLWIAKAAFIVTKLKIDAVALSWILVHAADVTITDLTTLPLAPVNTPVTVNDFTALENLVSLFNLHHSYAQTQPPATITIFNFLQDVIDGIKTLAVIESELCSLYGWDPVQLKALIDAPDFLNLTLTPPANSDLRNMRILIRIYKCFSVMALLGVRAQDCVNWSQASLSFDDSNKIKQTLKSKYSDADWLSVTQPLQNKLREQKRDALVTYLLQNPGTHTWVDADDLYSYFLIDVEMSACQPTSRIVQATNSMQQFVQRCFMNMEDDVTVNAQNPDQNSYDSKWNQWAWMKQYRLWEANRKVFLYPENWIEPDLLPKPSSFFTDLQNQLLQNEVTQPNVEKAFMTYLEKLDGVARLEMKGMWYEDDNQTLHVVGRTYGGDPKLYYYRQYIQNRRWTPWVKIDLDINSDHIIPVVFNQRLYLFWAVFTEKADDGPDKMTAPTPGQDYPLTKPTKYWQIQLAFSEYRNGKWTPKKVSNNDSTGIIQVYESYDPSSLSYSPDKSQFIFTPVDLPQPDFSNLQAYLAKKDIAGWWEAFIGDVEDSLKQNGTLNINCYVNSDGYFYYQGTFDLDPCRGYPVTSRNPVNVHIKRFARSDFNNMLDSEDPNNTTDNMLDYPSQPSILNQTPGIFRNLVSIQPGFLDRLIFLMLEIFYGGQAKQYSRERSTWITLGTFMPFFYQDATYNYLQKTGRTYYVAPELTDDDTFELFYSDLEAWFLQLLELLQAIIAGDAQKIAEIRAAMPKIPQGKSISFLYHFYNAYHPMVCYFMRQLFEKGIDGLMMRQTQLKGDVAYDSNPAKFNFNSVYVPQTDVYTGQPVTYPNGVVDTTPGYPREDVDFNIQSGYSLYNWELFYHAPLLIGERLSENQQFDDADKWFRYIFDPTDSSAYPSPDKFWVTKPFFLNVVDASGKTKYDLERIENIMFGIADPSTAHPNDLDKSVEDWRENPFQPHYIAQYRTVAYQKTAIRKYLDHLIRWGDYLFTQHTMESVTQATQIYVLADQILGKEPEIIPPAYEVPVNNYYQLEKKLDTFSNVLVEIENLLPLHTYQGFDYSDPSAPGLPSINALYFCIPFNDNILQYWKTISQRLFNIRHCLDINGVYSPLQLFAPPIDPGLLVRATAAGLDLSSILNDLNAPVPSYRFSIMIQKANELCGQLQSLGGALLSALEKKDAEHLALLRSGQEINLLTAVLQMKQQQITEAQNGIDNLTKQKELTTIKRDYYQNLISGGWNTEEIISAALTTTAIPIEIAATIIETLAGIAHEVPDFSAGGSGFGGTPHVVVKYGGENIGESLRAAGTALRGTAGALHSTAGLISTIGGYQRRADEWQNQLNMANKELEQLDVQILGAQIRLDIANKDRDNQQLQIDNAKESDDFMHSKFTNEDLYAWMIGKVSATFYQSYQLAYATAKKAERCFGYELGLSNTSYIQFGYWDSMKQGLQSGESMQFNLRQLEMAYYDTNKREYELTKNISLAQLDPAALMQLKQTGQCFISLPEEVFDMDYPGHYFRRMKSASFGIYCVAGPNPTVGCTVTLLKNSVRIDGTSVADAKKYPRKSVNGVAADDPRFVDGNGISQSIVLSQAQNDSGLFELNYRDERYLPFEYLGAISQWHLQFPFANTKDKSGTKTNPLVQPIDYNTVTDVIMQLKYTAREGGDSLKSNASDNLINNVNAMQVSMKDKGVMKLFSLRHEFPTEWYNFLNQPDPMTGDQTCSITIDANRLPYFLTLGNSQIKNMILLADTTIAMNQPFPLPALTVTCMGTPPLVNPPKLNFAFAANPAYGPLQFSNPNAQNWGNNTLGVWKIVKPGHVPLTSAEIKDMYVLVQLNVG
ncbi:MAG: hypothetical protein C5B59_18405 [Bacteroidetes bacterium]|nr:MAG: hypothetical protein C5B59_18405 [Bacteroidota bacterium]